MKRHITSIGVMLWTMALLGAPVWAQSAAPGSGAGGYYQGPPPGMQPGYHAHEDLFLRLLVGVGHTTMRTESVLGDVEIAGAGPGIGIAIGKALTPSLILFGEVFATGASDPELTLGDISDTAEGSVVVLTGVGPGLAYYFPSNIYLSGSLAFSQASVQDEDGVSTGETDIGVGLHALVGKEWWVSPRWGLGIAGQLFVGSMKDNAEDDDAPTWRTVALGLLLSATYD